MLLTRAPVAGESVATLPMPLDLHVLGLSLAFILSQDQTLRCRYLVFFFSIQKKQVTFFKVFALNCTFERAALFQPPHSQFLYPGPDVLYCLYVAG